MTLSKAVVMLLTGEVKYIQSKKARARMQNLSTIKHYFQKDIWKTKIIEEWTAAKDWKADGRVKNETD